MKIKDVLKSARNKFNKLTAKNKAMFISASIITVALLVSIPVLAWFGYRRQIMKFQKVDAPNTLILSAAHREDSTCFEIDGIDADEIAVDVYGNKLTKTVTVSEATETEEAVTRTEDQKITYKDYVFCVTGDSVDKFTIQLAYTTNNPFTYEVYAAKELTAAELATSLSGVPNGTPIDYVAYTVEGKPIVGTPTLVSDGENNYHLTAAEDDVLYYQIDKSITDPTNGTNAAISGKYTGQYLNSTDGTAANNDANNTYLKKAYGDTYTNIEADAKPVYWQTINVSAFPGKVNSNKDPFSRHFILRVKWNDGELKNTAKETDIIYISVKATS